MSNKKYQINLLPDGRQITAKPGKTLMESLMAKSIFLRSDCGGKGTCGKCRVKIHPDDRIPEFKKACKLIVSENISIEIPDKSLLSSHIINKAPVLLPIIFKEKFKGRSGKDTYGIATDLGTTTIAIYLCNMTKGRVISSLSIKNPQALYGDDVMSRIGTIGQNKKNLGYLQKLVVRAIEWGIREILTSLDLNENMISQMVTVGNPTMIHILAGIDPSSIGVFPYKPAFHESRIIYSKDLGFNLKELNIQLLPQVSGFIGGDILSAALAADLENQPDGTLLIDLGTNGELMFKDKEKIFATSCATGPAFEGASLSCGMQAIPGAINKVVINSHKNLPEYTFINPSKSSGLKPSGICGTGVISAVAQFCKNKIIAPGGAFKNEFFEKKQYDLILDTSLTDGSAVFLSQKDIRSVQLGKAALITGIQFLLKNAGFEKPEKIIIAGAFGTYLDKKDMITLGMIPDMDLNKIEISGNLAGAGAVMVLCDKIFLEKAIALSERINVVDLACNKDFQDVFVQQLNFPVL